MPAFINQATKVKNSEIAIIKTALTLKAKAEDVPDRVKALLDERKSLTNEVAQLRRELAMSGGVAQNDDQEINGISFFANVLSGVSGKDLPGLIVSIRRAWGQGRCF